MMFFCCGVILGIIVTIVLGNYVLGAMIIITTIISTGSLLKELKEINAK
jgi:hypothetical protein